jgi:hypothetical protein
MAGENEVLTLVGYKVDTGSVARAVTANKQVEASIKSVGAAASANALRFNTIAEAQAALGLSATQLGVTEGTVTSELQRQLPLAERLAEAARARASAETGTVAGLRSDAFGGSGAGSSSGGRTLGQNITRAGRGLFNAPDVGGSTAIARAAIAGGAVVDKLGLSVGQLGALAGVAGVGVVAVAVALERFNQGIAESKKLLEGALAAQSNYYDALANSTTEQATTQIAELQRTRPLLEQEAAQARDALNSAFTQLQQNHGDLSARMLISAEAFAPLRDAATEADAALQENVQTEERLTQGRESGVFAANDIAEAERQLAEARKQSAVNEADVLIKLTSSTQSERDERIAAINNEIAVLREQADAVGKGSEAGKVFEARIITLAQELELTTAATNTYGDALAREAAAKKAVTDAYDNYNELLDQEADAREDLADVQAKANDLVLKREEDIADLREDIADRTEQREEDLGERRAEIAEDNADKIAKIERDFGRSHRDAVRNRNVVADIQARERAADALADQNAAGKKQLENLEKQADKAARIDADTGEKRISRLIRDSQRQIDAENQKARQLEFLLAQSHQSQQFLTVNGFNAINNTWAQGMNNLVVLTNQAFNSMSANVLVGGGSTFPTLTESAAGREHDEKLKQKIKKQVDTRLRQVWK